MGMKRFSAPPALGARPPTCQPPPPPSPSPLSDDVPAVSFPAPPNSPSLHHPRGKSSHHQHHHHHHHHHRVPQQYHHQPHQQQQQQNRTHHASHHSKQSSHHVQFKHQPILHQQHQHQDSGKRVRTTEQTFESLFDKETTSDVTVKVNGEEYVFHAHRMILEMKSEVFAAMLAKLDNKPDIEIISTGGGGGRSSEVPVLHVQEDSKCSHVFSRFLYFLYSGSVWLHPDYVLPLYRLAVRYQVKSLKDHCQAYILQVLSKSCRIPSPGTHPQNINHSNNNNNSNSIITHNHCPPHVSLATSPNANSPPYVGNGFGLEAVCDLYEDEAFQGDIRQTAYRLLCCQFRQLVGTERWQRCRVQTVCSLISGDSCNVEENLILMSATDFMKRNHLSDKKQIEEILSLIRYPRLHRRVLYHLHKNGSFKNFPHIQELMLNALMFHSFKDLPEAKDDFVGAQFRPRMSNTASPNRRASMHVATCGLSDGQPEETDLSDSDYSLDPIPSVSVAQIRQSQV